MPSIKLPQGRSTLQDQVPGADLQVRSQGDLGNAYADLGRAVQGIGLQFMDAAVKAQATDYSYSKETEQKEAIKKYGDQLKLSTQPGGKDYSTKMEDFIKDLSQKGMSEAPTERARQAYQARTEHLHANSMIEAISYENKRNIESYINNTQKARDTEQRLLVESPDPTKFKDSLQTLNNYIDAQTGPNGLFDPTRAQIEKDNNGKELASSLLNGLAIQEKYDAGLKLLTIGKDGSESDVAKALSGEKKAYFLKQFTDLKQKKSEINTELINKNIKDFQYSAINNGKVDQQLYSKILTGLTSNNSLKTEDKKRIVDTLKTVVQASSEMQDLRKMSTDQLMNYEPKIDTKSSFNVASRADIANHLENYKNQLIKQRATDPMEVVRDQNPKIRSLSIQAQGSPEASREYIEQGLAAQQQLGVAKPRVTTKQEAVFNAQQLLASPNAASSDVVLQKLKAQYGEYLPNALDEMAKDNSGITHDFVIASYLPNQQARLAVIDNVLKQKDINKNFSESFHSPPDLKTPINKITSDLRQAVLRTDSAEDIGHYNAFVKQIELETKKTLALNPSEDPQKASARAYESVVSSNYEMIPSARSTIMMPKQANGIFNDPKAVENFVGIHSDAESLKKLNAKVPPAYKSADDWYSTIEKSLKWVTNSSLTGVQLLYKSPTTGKIGPVIDANNKVVQKSFKEIMIEAPQLKEESTQWFKKIKIGGFNGGY